MAGDAAGVLVGDGFDGCVGCARTVAAYAVASVSPFPGLRGATAGFSCSCILAAIFAPPPLAKGASASASCPAVAKREPGSFARHQSTMARSPSAKDRGRGACRSAAIAAHIAEKLFARKGSRSVSR